MYLSSNFIRRMWPFMVISFSIRTTCKYVICICLSKLVARGKPDVFGTDVYVGYIFVQISLNHLATLNSSFRWPFSFHQFLCISYSWFVPEKHLAQNSSVGSKILDIASQNSKFIGDTRVGKADGNPIGWECIFI